MNIMTKRGQLDNIVTYEHFCDDVADLANIPQEQITLGSIAVALKDGSTEGLIVYIADSNKQWIPLIVGGSGGSTPTPISDIAHICTQDEYDSTTGIPTVVLPIENTFYFVPAVDGETNNLFKEWIYVNGNWELFGSVDAPSGALQSDWDQLSSASLDFIKNKPFGEILLEYSEETDNFFVGQVVENSEPDSNGNYWISFDPSVYMNYLPNNWTNYPAVYCILKLDNQTYTALLTLGTYNEEQYYSVNIVHPDTQSAIVDFDFSQDPNVPFALCLAKDSAQNISSIGRLILSRTINDNFWTGMTFKFAPVMMKKIDKKYLPDDALAQSDWNENNNASTAYIKNRPCFINNSTETIAENVEINVTSMSTDGYYSTTSPVSLPGVSITPDVKYFEITYNGNVYTISPTLTSTDTACIGANPGTDNSYPCGIFYQKLDGYYYIPTVVFANQYGISTFSIKIIYETITHLDKRFLPTDIFNPVTGDLTIEGTSLTLGNTTITETQLQNLLSLSDATGVGF